MLSERMQGLTAGIFSELAERKRNAMATGLSVVDLTVGSPDLPPPSFVVEALTQHIQDGSKYGYTLSGIQSFHEAVAHFYHVRYGVFLDPKEQVLQLMGSQDGLAHLAMAVINPGDYVLVPDPGYPIYETSVRIAGGRIFPLPLLEENGFLPDLESIPMEVLNHCKLMIVNYPGNPVTTLATDAFFQELVAFAEKNNILIAHDFAYSELVFDQVRPISFLKTPGAMKVGIEFNSLSKTFNMAGCRIGYVVGNQDMLNALRLIKSHIDYGIFYPIQKAAEAALASEFSLLADHANIYERRRDVLIHTLNDVGWRIAKPPATMFAWARIPEGNWNSREFTFRLLEETGVAVTPGNAFGAQGEGFVRIALVQPEELLRDAGIKIGSFLHSSR